MLGTFMMSIKEKFVMPEVVHMHILHHATAANSSQHCGSHSVIDMSVACCDACMLFRLTIRMTRQIAAASRAEVQQDERFTCARTKELRRHTGSDDVHCALHWRRHITAAVCHIVGDDIGYPIC